MSKTRTFGLDFVRAAAIVLVIVGHAAMLFAPVTSFSALEKWVMPAEYGVELFFVLSGYLICGILATEFERGSFRLGTFWTRRWLRTLPNYYLFLLLNMVFDRCVQGSWPHAGLYFFFLQNLAWPHPYFFGEAWSLCVEEIFYLTAPLVLLAYCAIVRKRHRVLPLLGATVVVLTLVRVGYVLALDPVWDSGVRKIVAVRLDAFVYGAIAMYVHRYSGLSRKQLSAAFFAGSVAIALSVIACLVLDRDHDFFSRTLLFSLILGGFAAMLPAAAEWRASGWSAFATSSVRALAAWSYSLYVCHLLVMRLLTLPLGWSPKSFSGCLMQALAFCALSILCAALVHYSFERPILAWRDRLTATRAAVAADTPA